MSLSLFLKHLVVIVCLSVVILSHAQDESADDISILDIDGSGEVDALTDGLLLLRSMFGLTDDALISGTVTCTSDQCGDVAENIDARISKIKELKGDALKAQYADTCHFETYDQPYEILVVPKWNATEDEISQLQSRIKGVHDFVDQSGLPYECGTIRQCDTALAECAAVQAAEDAAIAACSACTNGPDPTGCPPDCYGCLGFCPSPSCEVPDWCPAEYQIFNIVD